VPSGANGSPAGVAEGGPLENYANKSSLEARNRRYEARAALWNVSTIPRCRKCGRVSLSAAGEVGVRVSDGHAGFAGLASCGSVWVCPVCSSKVMARRSLEVGAAVAAAGAEGLPVAFCTLTMRHSKNDRLATLWAGLAKGWGRATSGCKWDAQRTEFGVVGYVRVVEVTHGKNGWHVHVHALIFAEGFAEPGGLDGLMEPMWGRWSAGLQSQGLAAPLPVGSEWHVVGGDLSGTALGEYLAKGAGAAGAIGAELTQTQSKIARSVHSTDSHWSILRDGPVNGEVAGIRLWREWEKASKGKRQIAWSRGLRDRLGLLLEEKSDEDIAAEEIGSRDDTVVWITRNGWAALVRQPALIGQVLTAAEGHDTAGFSAWLWRNGIEHRRV
jgi:Replication protein